MTAPYVKTVLRPITKRSVLNRQQVSFRSISQRYLRGEHSRFVMLEVLIFVILAAMALWPIVGAATLIQTYRL